MGNAEWLARSTAEDLADAERSLARARQDLRDARAAVHRARAVRWHALARAAKAANEAVAHHEVLQ